MKKQIIMFVCAFSLLLGTPAYLVQAKAADIPITIQWLNAKTISGGITFSSNTADCYVMTAGNSDVVKIVGNYRLQVLNSNGTYSNHYTWSTITSYSNKQNFSGSCSVTNGKTYRLVANLVLTNSNNVSETIEVTFDETN